MFTQATEYQAGGVILVDAPPAMAAVVLAVTDINDNAPQFYSQTYTGYVPEDATINHIVLASVEAFDIDEVYIPIEEGCGNTFNESFRHSSCNFTD